MPVAHNRWLAFLLATVAALLLVGAQAPVAGASTVQADGGLTVSYDGAPGDCFAPCTLVATDALPADQATAVVGRQWKCINAAALNGGPNLAAPAPDGLTVTCVVAGPAIESVSIVRTYADGPYDVGTYQFKVRYPQDAPAPVLIDVPAQIATPATVMVYTPKTTAALDWFSAKEVGAGFPAGRSGPLTSGPHAGTYAFTFVVTAPRGRLKLSAMARNPTANRFDGAEATTVVTANNSAFHVYAQFAGGDLRHPARPLLVATLSAQSPVVTKWTLQVLLQRRVSGQWRTEGQRQRSGSFGGLHDVKDLFVRLVVTPTVRASLTKAICAGASYRVVGLFDLRSPTRHELLTAKRRMRTNVVTPRMLGTTC